MMPGSEFDQDGRLRIPRVPLTAATIDTYWGRELHRPGFDPDREYRLLRHPDALRKAARSFQGIPLLSRHAGEREITPDLIVGAIGTDAAFDGEVLSATVTVWTQNAIDAIGRNEFPALSAAYDFDVDMTPGRYRGQAYDSVLSNIVGHHCALVDVSRTGTTLDGFGRRAAWEK
jgi:uncharacterized protein